MKASFPAKRLCAIFCALILAVSTLPLYLISLYNHPYYDDYNFSAKTHSAWVETHSLSAVIQTAFESATHTRQTWQGTYTGTLLSNLQPGVFAERLYFITTFFLLTAFILCFAFFLKAVFSDIAGLDGAECCILISLTLTLLIQFMPDPDEAFYWFNGGIGNTFIYSLLALSLGLLIKLEKSRGKVAQGLLIAANALILVLLGGGSYGGGIFGLLIYGLIVGWSFFSKSRFRWAYVGFFLVFAGCFLYSMSAPGNGVRASRITALSGFQASPVKAIVQAMLYGTAVAGSYIRLPLIGVTALLIPFFVRSAQKRTFRFRYPLLVLVCGLCLYCTQFVPPLFGGVGIGGGRIVDTYYQSFVVMWLLFAYYITGWMVQRGWAAAGGLAGAILVAQRENAAQGLNTAKVQQRFVLVCCGAILIGCLGYKRPIDSLYGLPNMAGGNAALSILKGEAQQYHREMTDREVLLADASQPEVTLKPLTVVPDIFMDDLLAPDAVYDVRKSLCTYYNKTAIYIAGEEVR